MAPLAVDPSATPKPTTQRDTALPPRGTAGFLSKNLPLYRDRMLRKPTSSVFLSKDLLYTTTDAQKN